MTAITGTLAITDPAIPFTAWQARAHRITDGALVGSVNVTSNGATPVPYAIDCGEETEACLVTLAPAMGKKWTAESGFAVGDLCIPASGQNPYLHRVTAAASVPDPLAAQVSFYAPLDSDFLDQQGNTLLVEPLTALVADKPPATLDGSGSAAFTSATAAGTSGLSCTSTAFDPGASPGADQLCIECWVKVADSPSDEQTVLDVGPREDGLGIVFLNNRNTGEFLVAFGQSGALWGNLGVNEWRHVAYQRNGQYHTLYIDGELHAEQYYDCNLSGLSSLHIGRSIFGDDPRFEGNICRVRVTRLVPRYQGNFTPPSLLDGTPGRSGTTEPAWPTTDAGTVLDGALTWQRLGRMVQPMTHGWAVPA